ncbi:lactate/malate family dehydrogenase [Streptomyces colonosanans]|uniref:lactate/malate family dehydrogenase n=1 Tax=Streptomyces colonosanans TaxID=1428652 RepID=UPI0009A10DCE
MKVGIVGVGAVGAATALSLVERGGTCREIVLIDRDTPRADGVAADLGFAAPLSPALVTASLRESCRAVASARRRRRPP